MNDECYILQDAPFFVDKLQVRVLPCLIVFLHGVAVARVTGFDDLGGKDDFKTVQLESKLLKAGAVEEIITKHDSDDEDAMLSRRTMYKGNIAKTASDEDSDFD